jgi:hypothetical protein
MDCVSERLADDKKKYTVQQRIAILYAVSSYSGKIDNAVMRFIAMPLTPVSAAGNAASGLLLPGLNV